MSIIEQPNKQQQVSVKQVIPGVAWEIDPLLSEHECQELIQRATQAGIQRRIASGDQRYRNCCTHHLHDENLSQTIWERVMPHVPRKLEFDREDISQPPPGFQSNSIKELLGSWTARNANPQFTLLYYTPGAHFGPHRDDYKVLSEHERSLLTLSIYLTARLAQSGGATQFLQDNMTFQGPDETGRIQAPAENILASVQGDSVGKAVLFWHDVMHQGQPLADEPNTEPKWLLVTQIVYERDPDSAPKRTNDEKLAREYLKQAEEAEMQGNISCAIRFYKRAYRLDPSLE